MYPEVFSDYIVYADESGDHSLVSIDQRFRSSRSCFASSTSNDMSRTSFPLPND